MKVSEMLDSKYLKTQDIDGEVTVTVKSIKKANLARDDEPPEYKWTMMFEEYSKALVLNKTNIKRLEKALGDDTELWVDQRVILYVDENIQYGADIVSGLRLRGLPRQKMGSPLPQRKHDERDPPPSDEIPF